MNSLDPPPTIRQDSLEVPGPPAQSVMAATVTVTLTRAQAKALLDAAEAFSDRTRFVRVDGPRLLGARGILRAHLEGRAVPPAVTAKLRERVLARAAEREERISAAYHEEPWDENEIRSAYP